LRPCFFRLVLTLVLALGLLLPAWAQAGSTDSEGADPFAGVASAYLVEVDGAVVWQSHSAQRLAPASLTKLMTALLVVEQIAPDAAVSVDAAAARETGGTLGLRKGEILHAKDLLAATLIASANDACRALAEHAAGDQARFVQRMNQRAQQMGLRNTHFTNACGHDAPQHVSSAADLRVLAHALMQSPLLSMLVAQSEMQIATLDGQRHFALHNKNALIGRYAGAVGIKTGTTPGAGKCLVALATRGKHTVLVVLLKAKDRWWDTVDILDIAFARAQATP
jgi:D-alanyl-D-alanine carboxypeptidase (penicillin-binding protein 5/6)